MSKSVSEITIQAHLEPAPQQNLDDAIPPISVAELMEIAHSLFSERPHQRFSTADHHTLATAATGDGPGSNASILLLRQE
jgi:hypothetical protein